MSEDRYVPGSSSSRVAPWPSVHTRVQNIRVKCYHNAPREEVLREMVPYTMEISTPGNNFICIGNPIQECPESVHRGTDPKDPWRQRQCAAWRQTWERQAADIIASQDFRDQVTENILNIAGIPAWQRALAKPAEFIQVLEEREGRERAIKIASILALAAGGGVILWSYLKGRKETGLEQNPAARSYRTVHEPPIEHGDGDNPPGRESRPFIKKIIDEMVKSAAREGLGAHHVQWNRSGANYRIGNRAYNSQFGVFEIWFSGDEPQITYKTSSLWTRFRHAGRFDTENKLSKSEALDLARNYYSGLKDELLTLERKVKDKYGQFSRSYVVYDRGRTYKGNPPERNIPLGAIGGLLAVGTAAAVVAGIAIKRANDRREHIAIYVTGRRASGQQVEPEFRLAANSLGGLINATIYGAGTGQAILDALRGHDHIERLTLFGHGAPESFMLPGVSGIRVGRSQLPAWVSVEDLAAAIGPKLRAGAIIGLAGCAAGANPGQERDWNTAYQPGGENSFAARLRDALSRIPGIAQGIEIRAHTRTGHTTANPSAIIFRVGPDYIGTPGTPVIDEKWGTGTSSDTANQQHFAGEFRAGAQQRRSPADKWMVGEDWWSTLTLPPNPVWAQTQAA